MSSSKIPISGSSAPPSRNQRQPWLLWFLLAALPLAAVSWLAFRVRPQAAVDEPAILLLASRGQFDDAEAALVDHLRRSPDDPRAHFLLAQILIDRTDLPAQTIDPALAGRALEHLNRANALNPGGTAVDPAELQLYRGKALYQLRRWDAAERAWLAALRLDPRVPEAGWSLLDLYYLESRSDDARRLALQLFDVEPDPKDRAQLLLELIRRDAIPVSPLSLIPLFEAALAAEPDALRVPIALAHSLIRNSEAERGLALLRDLAARHPKSLPAHEGLLAGLDLATQPEAIAPALSQLPISLRDSPELARFRAVAAQVEGRWPDAAREFRIAVDRDPTDFEALTRLERAARFAGNTDEADQWATQIERFRLAQRELLDLYEQASLVSTLGVRPHPELCVRLAAARDAMRRPDEASLWRHVVGPGAIPITTARPPGVD